MWSFTVWSRCLFSCWENFKTGAWFGNHVSFSVKMKRKQWKDALRDLTRLSAFKVHLWVHVYNVLLIIACIYRPPLPLAMCLSLRISLFDLLETGFQYHWYWWSLSQTACRKIQQHACFGSCNCYIWMSSLRSLFSCFTRLHLVRIYLLSVKTLITASFLLQCVCGRWMSRYPRAASRWPAAKRPSCPAPSPPALPSTTSTSSGWWYHCLMPTSQNRYSVHHSCTHSITATEHSCSLFCKIKSSDKLKKCEKRYSWHLNQADRVLQWIFVRLDCDECSAVTVVMHVGVNQWKDNKQPELQCTV